MKEQHNHRIYGTIDALDCRETEKLQRIGVLSKDGKYALCQLREPLSPKEFHSEMGYGLGGKIEISGVVDRAWRKSRILSDSIIIPK